MRVARTPVLLLQLTTYPCVFWCGEWAHRSGKTVCRTQTRGTRTASRAPGSCWACWDTSWLSLASVWSGGCSAGTPGNIHSQNYCPNNMIIKGKLFIEISISLACSSSSHIDPPLTSKITKPPCPFRINQRRNAKRAANMECVSLSSWWMRKHETASPTQ